MSSRKHRASNLTDKLQLRQKKKEAQLIQKAKVKRKFAGFVKHELSKDNRSDSFYNKFFSGEIQGDDAEQEIHKFKAVDNLNSAKRKAPSDAPSSSVAAADESSSHGSDRKLPAVSKDKLKKQKIDSPSPTEPDSKPTQNNKHAKKKPQPFLKEKLEWQKKLEEQRQQEEERLQQKKQHRAKRVEREKKRHMMMARSKTGQPIMRHMLSHLLQQLQPNASPSSASALASDVRPSVPNVQKVHMKR